MKHQLTPIWSIEDRDGRPVLICRDDPVPVAPGDLVRVGGRTFMTGAEFLEALLDLRGHRWPLSVLQLCAAYLSGPQTPKS